MSETAGASLVHLSMTEIAERINAHLRRLEVAEWKRRTAEGTVNELGASFYYAGASRQGNRVSVRYITYQGSDNLTREEALHYLAGLNAGFEGRHFEWFRQSPPPEPDAAETRFVALIQGDRFEGYYLYAVTKRTATRIYGRRLGKGYSRSFLPRESVVKLRATEDDLRRINEAERARREKIAAATREANAEFDAVLEAVNGNSPDDAADRSTREA